MDWIDVLTAAIGLIGGGGGVVAWYRARAQNKVDAGRLVFEQQTAFQQSLAAEVARLSALVQVLGSDKDKLEGLLAEQGRLLERLKTLDEIKTGQIEKLEALNKELSARVDEQQREIQALRDEKATIGQQLATVLAEKGFLERENGELRREISVLRGLPVPPIAGANG
jgi:chromosome segregation ATPase